MAPKKDQQDLDYLEAPESRAVMGRTVQPNTVSKPTVTTTVPTTYHL
jgi:hypothetical protein